MLAMRCTRCRRKVSLGPDGVRLWERPDGCRLFRFACPECGFDSRGCADRRRLRTFRRAGVQPIVIPAEALEDHAGAPISLDDLIDLHLLLRSGSWEEHLGRLAG